MNDLIPKFTRQIQKANSISVLEGKGCIPKIIKF